MRDLACASVILWVLCLQCSLRSHTIKEQGVVATSGMVIALLTHSSSARAFLMQLCVCPNHSVYNALLLCPFQLMGKP